MWYLSLLKLPFLVLFFLDFKKSSVCGLVCKQGMFLSKGFIEDCVDCPKSCQREILNIEACKQACEKHLITPTPVLTKSTRQTPMSSEDVSVVTSTASQVRQLTTMPTQFISSFTIHKSTAKPIIDTDDFTIILGLVVGVLAIAVVCSIVLLIRVRGKSRSQSSQSVDSNQESETSSEVENAELLPTKDYQSKLSLAEETYV